MLYMYWDFENGINQPGSTYIGSGGTLQNYLGVVFGRNRKGEKR